jgi:hypothetical protein
MAVLTPCTTPETIFETVCTTLLTTLLTPLTTPLTKWDTVLVTACAALHAQDGQHRPLGSLSVTGSLLAYA